MNKMACYILPSKIIWSFIDDKPAPGSDYTIYTILDIFVNSAITLLIEKLEMPRLYYSTFLPLNQHFKKLNHVPSK